MWKKVKIFYDTLDSFTTELFDKGEKGKKILLCLRFFRNILYNYHSLLYNWLIKKENEQKGSKYALDLFRTFPLTDLLDNEEEGQKILLYLRHFWNTSFNWIIR